jgi:hypothetical protein
MNIILENIRKVLLENRVDDVKKKYPEVDPAIIDYFVKEDPSGNNKYLDWLVKAMTHGPTIQSVEDILDEAMQFNTPQEFLMMLVKKFHELLPYMVYVEDGKKVGTTDLYQYKFTDSEMINFLGFDLSQAKERKDEKNKQKDAKKNSDKIYEDKNWLVVRPKNWESSCVYGAGTKWCTTSKENSSHFKRETDRNFLIYVINKNKTSKDTEYKVAWQIPYTKKVNKYVTSTPGNPSVWTLNTDKIKLWNAEDTNIASRGSSGYDYLDTVPASVKGNILKYMQRQMDEMYANMAYVEDPYTQALVEHLALSEEEVEEVEQRDYGYYGMRVYTVDGSDDYAVATTDEVERAKHEWAENYINDLGIWEAIGNNPEKYIYINDPRTIANDMAENYIGDLNDDDILHEGKRLDKETKAMVEEWEVNQSIMETNQEDIDDMMERYGELDEDEEQELSELEIENESIEKTNDKLLQSIKDRIRDDYYETYVTRMTDDPLDWLEEFGYWSSKTGLDKFAIKNGLVGIDETELINDMADDLDYEYFSRTGNYEYVNIEGDRYYIFPTD